MDVLTAVAPVLGTNCYVVVADDGVSCVVVDVGAGIAGRVRAIVAERKLRPVAVLATHGHVDHTWGAAEVGEAFGIPLYIHVADAYRLANPFGTLGLGEVGDHSGGPLAQALVAAGISPSRYRAPIHIETFGGESRVGVPGIYGGDVSPDSHEGRALDLGGLLFAGAPLAVMHAPGHTEGASLYLIDGRPGPGSVLPLLPGAEALRADSVRTALTGDVIFAGTIGRTDLPGGDDAMMAGTLRYLAATLHPGTLMLPGHGFATRMDLELRRNPYLAG